MSETGQNTTQNNEEEKSELDPRIKYDESGEGTTMWIPLYIIEIPKKVFQKFYPYFAGAVFHRPHCEDENIEIVKGKLTYVKNFLNIVDQYLETTEAVDVEDNSKEVKEDDN